MPKYCGSKIVAYGESYCPGDVISVSPNPITCAATTGGILLRSILVLRVAGRLLKLGSLRSVQLLLVPPAHHAICRTLQKLQRRLNNQNILQFVAPVVACWQNNASIKPHGRGSRAKRDIHQTVWIASDASVLLARVVVCESPRDFVPCV